MAQARQPRGAVPASTAPHCVPLIAETATNQATLGAELPPPHINGTLAITRTNRQLWYHNGGVWIKCAI
jgi:hypothetical protein